MQLAMLTTSFLEPIVLFSLLKEGILLACFVPEEFPFFPRFLLSQRFSSGLAYQTFSVILGLPLPPILQVGQYCHPPNVSGKGFCICFPAPDPRSLRHNPLVFDESLLTLFLDLDSAMVFLKTI